jgi:hypothetical protein
MAFAESKWGTLLWFEIQPGQPRGVNRFNGAPAVANDSDIFFQTGFS